jgi:hypothetical protein
MREWGNTEELFIKKFQNLVKNTDLEINAQ